MTQENSNKQDVYAIADQLLSEIAGRKEDICIMMGVRQFYAIEPQEGKHLGGVGFKYSRNLVSNKSNLFRIYALPNGKRLMEWSMLRGGNLKVVETENDVEPAKLEEVWWNHTGCAIRTPWILDAFKNHKRFELGKTLMTPGADQEFSQQELGECLKRHHNCDWGDICEEDKGVNERSLKNGSRLLSVYKFEDGRVLWIITEAKDDQGKRACTTLLLPDEY